MLEDGQSEDEVACARCQVRSVNVSTEIEHEAGRVTTTRTLECTRCGYRRTWMTVRGEPNLTVVE